MSKQSRTAFTGAIAVAGLVLATPTAHAAVIEQGTDLIDETFSFTCDRGTSDESDDFTVEETTIGEVTYRLNARGKGEFLYFSGRGQTAATYSVVGTDVQWTATSRWLEKDLRILSVDGPFVTLLVGSSFHFDVFGPDGLPDASNDGRNEFTLIVDTTTWEAEFGEGTKFVGRIGAVSACADAVRFASM
jgi:hypothetical protein